MVEAFGGFALQGLPGGRLGAGRAFRRTHTRTALLALARGFRGRGDSLDRWGAGCGHGLSSLLRGSPDSVQLPGPALRGKMGVP
jgi:hypothetical protein